MCNKLLILVTILLSLSLPQLHAGEPVNLARKAKVSASSVYSREYLSCWAVDGEIPQLECKADERQAWSVKGANGMSGEFTLTWGKTVEIVHLMAISNGGSLQPGVLETKTLPSH
jgi:hypothetical protein